MSVYKYFHSFFKQNLSVKIGVFILSVFLWFSIVVQNEYVYTIKAPLVVRNIREDKAIKEPIPDYVSARFHARGSEFLKALLLKEYADFKFVLDVQRISYFYTFHLNDYFQKNPEKVALPRGFDLQFLEIVYPDSVNLVLDSYFEKEVPVKAAIKIKTASGYITVGETKLNPDKVILSGPKTYVQPVDTIYTIDKEFSDIDAPFSAKLPLQFSLKSTVSISHKDVEITQDVQSIGEIQIWNIPVRIKNLPQYLNVLITPSTVSAIITGGVEFISKLKPEDINVYIDYRDQWVPNKYYYVPIVEVPPDVISWRDLNPKQIEVRIMRSQSAE